MTKFYKYETDGKVVAVMKGIVPEENRNVICVYSDATDRWTKGERYRKIQNKDGYNVKVTRIKEEEAVLDIL